MSVTVEKHVQPSHRGNLCGIVDMAVSGKDHGVPTLDVRRIRHYGERQHHLVYLRIAVSAD